MWPNGKSNTQSVVRAGKARPGRPRVSAGASTVKPIARQARAAKSLGPIPPARRSLDAPEPQGLLEPRSGRRRPQPRRVARAGYASQQPTAERREKRYASWTFGMKVLSQHEDVGNPVSFCLNLRTNTWRICVCVSVLINSASRHIPFR